MAFNWNFKPKTLSGFNSAPVESLMPQAPGAIPTQMKGQEFSPNNNMQGLPQGNENYQRAAYMDAYEADEAQKAQALQAQQAGQQKRIADIQSQITTLEKRIAENTARLQNWTGNADKIAAIEARKFNSSDPTSIWRWKVDKEEAKKIANVEKAKGDELAKQNAQYEIDNELSSMIVDNKMTSNDEKVFLSKLATLRTLAQKSGLPTDKIDAKIKEVKGEDKTVVTANSPEGSKFEGKPREQWTAEANDLLGNKKAKSKDIQNFLDQAGDNLDNDTRIKLNSAYRDLAKKEADKADAEAMHAYSEELGFGKWDLLSDRMKETVKRMWKTKKGKK